MVLSRSWGGALMQALAISSVCGSCAAADAQSYVDNTVAAIKTLNHFYYDAGTGIWDKAWWNSANVLTTLADFTTLRLDEANQLNIGGIMRTTYNQAQLTTVKTSKSVNKGMVISNYCFDGDSKCTTKRSFLGKRGFAGFKNEFIDDSLWWQLAWIRCYDAAGDQEFLDTAVDIFNYVQRVGTNTNCGGGVYWNLDRKYVNAISNELYLAAAASLARRIPGNSTYLDIAKSQWDWLNKSGMKNAQGLFNDGLNGECKNNNLQTWTYNQGVILGALTELALATGDGSYIQEAVKIAKAAIKKLANSDGILVEVDKCELRDGHCGADGSQFKGVFVRNLRYLHQVAPEEEFKKFILRNADSIWKNDRNSQNQLGVAWTGPYIPTRGTAHSSAMDVLVAAIAVA